MSFGRELLLQADALAREKNVSRDIVFSALEMALASALKKRYLEDVDVRVAIDRNTGNYNAFRRWKIVPDGTVELAAQQIPLSEASQKKADAKAEDFIEEPSSRSTRAASARRPPSRCCCSASATRSASRSCRTSCRAATSWSPAR
jgi:hypothetical protein